LECASVTVRENEPVAVDPLGVLGVGVEEAGCGEASSQFRTFSRLVLRRPPVPELKKRKKRGEKGTHRRERGRPAPFPWAHQGDPSWPIPS
jgi:hypothetical protein